MANVAYRKFSEQDCKKTIALLQGIYEDALKSNEHLGKGVLTGVQYIAQSGMLSGLNNLGKYDFTNAKYAQHYGLDQSEVDYFFAHFQVPQKLGGKAKRWYNGYTVKRYAPESPAIHFKELIDKYNIWSIVSYLKDSDFEHFQSYWEQSGSIDFLDDLFTKPNVREEVEKLVNDNAISFVRIADFSANNFKTLKEMLGGNKVMDDNGLAVLFSYLFIGGYLTPDESAVNAYRLPNMELTYEMQKRLITYYQTLYTVDPGKMQQVTDVLQQVMDIDGAASPNNLSILLQDFYNQFREVIRSIGLVNQQNTEGVFTNEDIIHSILNYIALQTQHTTMGSELYTKKLPANTKGRADLKITQGNIGMIL